MRYMRWAAPPLITVGILLAAGCGANGMTSVDLSGNCVSLSDQLSRAQDAVDKSTTKMADDAGTPAEQDDKTAKATAQQNVNTLAKALHDHGWTPECESASPTPTATSAAASPATTLTDAQLASVQQQVAKKAPDYPHDQAVVTRSPDWNQPEERGTTYFSGKTLKSQAAIAAFLKGTSQQSTAAKDQVIAAIRAAGYGDDEVAHALDGSGYVALQLKQAAQVFGNTYFKDGKVWDGNQWWSVGPDDVYWLFVTKDTKVVWGATLRADCGNPGLANFRPITSRTPPAPPAGTPSRTPSQVTVPPSTHPGTTSQPSTTPTTTGGKCSCSLPPAPGSRSSGSTSVSATVTPTPTQDTIPQGSEPPEVSSSSVTPTEVTSSASITGNNGPPPP